MSRRERRRLVEKEKLRVAAGRHQPQPSPAAEVEPASDPPPRGESAADLAAMVVKAAAIAVDESARGAGDQLAERCDAILERRNGLQGAWFEPLRPRLHRVRMAASAALVLHARPNQRARRTAPNSSFSAAYSREGSWRWAAGASPRRKLTSTLLTSP